MSAVEAPSEPVRKTVHVACDVEKAFRVFVERIDEWWPVERFSRVADEQYPAGVTLERVVLSLGPVAGCTRSRPPARRVGADVVAYEPPRRLVLAWKPTIGRSRRPRWRSGSSRMATERS